MRSILNQLLLFLTEFVFKDGKLQFGKREYAVSEIVFNTGQGQTDDSIY